MSSRKVIATILRDTKGVHSVSKNEFEVSATGTPFTLVLNKQGLYVGGARTISYNDSLSYLKGLLGINAKSNAWDKAEFKSRVNTMAALYGSRVVKVKKGSIYLDDPENPTRVKISHSGEVRIYWSGDKGLNIYDYDDAARHLTEYGPRPVPNIAYTGFATMQEIESEPALMAKLLGPSHPQPRDISIEAIRANNFATISRVKQYWHHPESNEVFSTEPDSDVTLELKMCVEITKPRAKELTKRQGAKKVKVWPPAEPKTKSPPPPIEGGAPLKKKALKKAQKKAARCTTISERVRMLIFHFDADNETIMDIAECDDKAVQRVRRKMLKESIE